MLKSDWSETWLRQPAQGLEWRILYIIRFSYKAFFLCGYIYLALVFNEVSSILVFNS